MVWAHMSSCGPKWSYCECILLMAVAPSIEAMLNCDLFSIVVFLKLSPSLELDVRDRGVKRE